MTWAFLVAVGPPAPTGDARDVIWALLALNALLLGLLGLFIRSVLRERDYWRQAFFAQQAATQEALSTGKVVRAVFEQAQTPTTGPPAGGGTT